MADTNETEGQQVQDGAGKTTTPKRSVFHIAKVEGKDVWTRVGVAFLNKDQSLNVILNKTLPAGGKLHIREEKAKAKPEVAIPAEKTAA